MPNHENHIHSETPFSDNRVARLRKNLIETPPEIFAQRALLVTQAYQEAEDDPTEIRRAKAISKILYEGSICIKDDELIVGCKVPLPNGSPIYPEFNVQWLEEELDTLAGREETPFKVAEKAKEILRQKVVPFWKGRTIYDRIIEKAPKKALDAADEGLLFHYYLDRSIGHISVNYEKVLKFGLSGIKEQIASQRATLDKTRTQDTQKEIFYDALQMVADAAIGFSHRYAVLAEKIASTCDDPQRQRELETISQICRRVPEHPAGNFYEALQSFWFIHLILNLESNSYAISPGRFCQYIHPFYKADLDNNKIDEQRAQELIDCLWIKFNEMTVVKAGATAKASNTYVDFQNLNIGGLRPDGRDGTNDVSYFCLNALENLKLPQPQLSCLISSKTDRHFLIRACEVIRCGIGMPAMFNDDVKITSLLAAGKTLEDARRGGINGCVEVNVQGCDNMASTGYVNLVKCLELALNNGVSMTTGKRLGPKTGSVLEFKKMADVLNAFEVQLKAAVALKINYDKAAKKAFADHCPAIATSLVMDDCIAKGKDFHQNGARYNAPMMCGVGLGTLADSLAAIHEFCFISDTCTLSELHRAIADNFKSCPLLRKQLWQKAPKFGNNDDRADQFAVDTVSLFCDILKGYTNEMGESYGANMIPTTTHIPMGHGTGASPDGRYAGAPLSEGVSSVQGQDTQGPTGVILSLAKIDHARTAGTLLNLKFTPPVLEGQASLEKFASLIQSFFARGGYHLQFNVVSKETLLKAQADPEAHRSLIVRVAGYSDYFNALSKNVQDEIISRTAHGEE